jgi:CRP-like cAMP-binding protein
MTQTTIDLFRMSEDLQRFSAGQSVFKVGDAGAEMYAVVEGEVEIRIGDRTVETVGPGGIFGEMALVSKSPRSADAVAKSDCALAAVPERRFRFLVQQTPYFAIQVMQVMAERLRRSD